MTETGGNKRPRPSTTPSADAVAAAQAAVKSFAVMLSDFERRLIAIERTPSLANSAIMNGALRAYTGTTQTLIIGLQYDGSNAAVPVSSPPPPVPYRPTVVGRPGGIVVGWDGKYADPITGVVAPFAVAPMDFAGVDVVVSQDNIPDWIATPPKHRFTSARGGEVFIAVPTGTWKVALVTRGQAGNASAASVPVEGIAPAIEVGTDGIEPQGQPGIDAVGGLGAILVRVTTPIANDDPVMYEYHVSPTPFSAIPNDDGTIAHRGPETSVTIRKYPHGDPIGPNSIGEAPDPVYVRVIAYDPDGFGPQSVQREATPIQVTSADIAANQGWFGYLQATDFRSGTVSGDVVLGGRFATLGAGENVGQGMEIAAGGARWFNELGKVVVDIPSDLSVDNPATFSGKGIFTQLEAISGVTMRGTSRVSQGAELLLVNQQGPPGIAPVASPDLDSTQFDMGAAMSTFNAGQAFPVIAGLQWHTTAGEWLVCVQSMTGGKRARVLRFSTAGAYLGELVSFSISGATSVTLTGWAMTSTRHFLALNYGTSTGTLLYAYAREGQPALTNPNEYLPRKIGDANAPGVTLSPDDPDLLISDITKAGFPRTARMSPMGDGPNLLPQWSGVEGTLPNGYESEEYTVAQFAYDPVDGEPAMRMSAFAETNPVSELLAWTSNSIAVQPRRNYRFSTDVLAQEDNITGGNDVAMRVHFYDSSDQPVAGHVEASEYVVTNTQDGYGLAVLTADAKVPDGAVAARLFFDVSGVQSSSAGYYFYNTRIGMAPGWNVTLDYTSVTRWSNRERQAASDAATSGVNAIPSGVVRRTDSDMGSVERWVVGPSRTIAGGTVVPYRSSGSLSAEGWEWPGPPAATYGFTFGNGAYHALGSDYRLYRFTNVSWSDDGNTSVAHTWFAGYTWRDTDANGGTHESGLSPLTRFTMKKRHRAVITTGTVPSHSGNSDAVNAVGFYLGRAPDKVLIQNYASSGAPFVQTYTAHGLVVGDVVTVGSALNRGTYYSGTFTVVSVVNSTQVVLNAFVGSPGVNALPLAINKANPLARTLMAYQSSLAVEPSLTVAATLNAPNPIAATSTNTITGLTHGPDPAGVYAFPNATPGRVVSSARRGSISNLPKFGVDGDGNGRWDDLMPPGAIILFGGPVIPTNWRTCEGQALSAALHPDTYAALGGSASPWGVNLVAGTFNLPKLQGRSPVGVGASGQGNVYALAQEVGSEQMQQHSHTGSGSGTTGAAAHQYGYGFYPEGVYGQNYGAQLGGGYVGRIAVWDFSEGLTHSHPFSYSFTTANSGTGNAGNVHPVTGLYYIIKVT